MPRIWLPAPGSLTWMPLPVWRWPSVLSTALEQRHTKIPLAIETLDAAIETLVAVRRKGDQTGVWEIIESERPSILNGIDMAEQCIGTLDVALLEQTAANLHQFI